MRSARPVLAEDTLGPLLRLQKTGYRDYYIVVFFLTTPPLESSPKSLDSLSILHLLEVFFPFHTLYVFIPTSKLTRYRLTPALVYDYSDFTQKIPSESLPVFSDLYSVFRLSFSFNYTVVFYLVSKN